MSAGRRRTPSGDVARAILDAAERLLVEQGPGALTVRSIADAAGVAPMSVYNHFEGKQGVLDALMVRGFDGLTGAVSVADTGDPIEDLMVAGRRYREFAREHPAHYELMFLGAVPDYEPSALALEHAWASFEQLRVLVQRAMSAGVLDRADATDVAQQIWTTCHGAAALELRGIGFVDDALAHQDELSRSLLRGLGAP